MTQAQEALSFQSVLLVVNGKIFFKEKNRKFALGACERGVNQLSSAA